MRNIRSAAHYLAKAFGEHLAEVRAAMEKLADRYQPAERNRIGFRLYEKFRPDVPPSNEGWGAKTVLDVEQILSAPDKAASRQ